MNNVVRLTVRAFPVRVVDERTGTESTDTIVLTRQQLQAAQLVGESSKELIHRLFNRQGYRVTDICAPIKRTIPVDLYQSGCEIIIEGDARTDQGAIS